MTLHLPRRVNPVSASSPDAIIPKESIFVVLKKNKKKSDKKEN